MVTGLIASAGYAAVAVAHLVMWAARRPVIDIRRRARIALSLATISLPGLLMASYLTASRPPPLVLVILYCLGSAVERAVDVRDVVERRRNLSSARCREVSGYTAAVNACLSIMSAVAAI